MHLVKSQSGSIAAWVLGAVGVLALLFWVMCVRVVGVGQVGVVTRLGQVNRHLDSGVALKLPFPFESLSTFDIKTQKDQADADAASQDLQDVKATVVTNYHIDNNKVDDLYRTVGVDYKSRVIDPAIQESVKAATANFPIAELITKRAEVKASITKSLQDRLSKRGIVVEDVSLTNLSFSQEYTQAIEQKQVAQQKAEQAQFNLQKAQVDAQANQVQQAALTDQILEQQAIAKWDGHMPQFVGQGSVFSIPVGK